MIVPMSAREMIAHRTPRIRSGSESMRVESQALTNSGIDPAVLAAWGKEGHYGLHGMQERASVIGGRLTVWSEPNIGTEVELRVPARAAYARTPQATRVAPSVERGSWT